LWNAAGNLEIGTGDVSNAGPTYTWLFGNDGVLTLPNADASGFGNIYFEENSSTITFGLDDNATPYLYSFSTSGITLPKGGIVSEGVSPSGLGNTIALTPSGGSDADQQLLIYPTGNVVVDGNHLHLTTGNLLNTELYLGNDDFYVKLANTGNIIVNTAGNTAQWTFGADGRLVNLDGLTLTAGGQFNICTILTGGSGYNTGSALKATTGGSGTGMTVGIGYGLSNQLANADVVDPGTGYVDGDVITVSGGTDGTFVITRYNDQANQANNNFVESNWTLDAAGGTVFPNLTTQRGDTNGGTITGQTLLFGDNTQEAIISTPNGNVDYISSQRLVINPGQGYGSGEGGDIYLWAGRGGADSGSGGDVKIRGGFAPADGPGGYIRIEGGNSQANGAPGFIEITGGEGGNTAGGYVNVTGGQGTTIGGDVKIYGGYGTATGGNVNIWGGASGNGQINEGYVNIQTGGKTWIFDTAGNLAAPGNISAVGNVTGAYVKGNGSELTNLPAPAVAQDITSNGAMSIMTYDGNLKYTSYATVEPSSGNIAGGNISTTGNITGGNILTNNYFYANGSPFVSSNYGNANVAANLAAFGSNPISTTGNITAGNFVGNGAALTNVTISLAGNIVGTQPNVTLVAGSYSTVFDNTGNLTLPGNTFAVNYANNTPVPVVTKVENSWTVPVGNSTQSFTVGINETYQMWVDCNIPNGILVWNATATVTNTNVPVVGQQFAWVYNGGGTPIDFTSIPNQFIGTANAIVRSNTAPSVTTNRFDFGINNTSGGNVTVRYGWIAIS
jgi:hypothetical protein